MKIETLVSEVDDLGRVVIPKILRDDNNITPGTRLGFVQGVNGKILIEKMPIDYEILVNDCIEKICAISDIIDMNYIGEGDTREIMQSALDIVLMGLKAEK